MSTTALRDSIEREARAQVRAVLEDPEARLALRQDFYRRYGFRDHFELASEYGMGASELDFMKWEIARGVLDPVRPRGRGGSAWWRGVNGDFLYYGQLARLAHESGTDPELLPLPARAWVEYIAAPGERTWYRAHNASIVAGYVTRIPVALRERRAEQIFINVVLYRLLYAQGMVEGAEMGELGRILANPCLPSVDALVHLPDFYPRHYPLRRADMRALMHRAHGPEAWLELFLDEVLILPHLVKLYQDAADWLPAPDLPTFVRDGEPVYPALRPYKMHRYLWVRLILLTIDLWRGLRRA